jgi:probable HAF family extracellular repeat protein
VGYSNDTNGNTHPWVHANGVTRNLNDLIEPGSAAGAPLFLAFDINDRGEITGTTTTLQTFVATPVWKH